MGVGVIHRAIDPIGLKNSGGSTIDPATEQKQNSAITELQAIKENLDDLDRNQGASTAETLRVVPATDANVGVYGSDTTNRATTSNPVPTLTGGGNRLDPNNNQSGNLGAGAAFVGTFTNISKDGGVLIVYTSDVELDTFQIQYSDDGVSPSGVTRDVPAIDASGTFVYLYHFPAAYEFYRINLLNGASPQTTHLSKVAITKDIPSATIKGVSKDVDTFDLAQLVRNVATGEEVDGLLQPTGVFANVQLVNGGIKTAIPWRTLLKYATPTDAALPSGPNPAIDPVLNVEANVIDTGWIAARAYPGGLFVSVLSSVDVDVYLAYASDDAGNNARGLSAPAVEAVANVPAQTSGAFLDDYFRAIVVNKSGSTASSIAFRAMGLQTEAPDVVFSLDQPLPADIPAGVTQAVLKGQSPAGSFRAVRASGTVASNSTTALLPANDVFVGELVRSEGFQHITALVNSDQASATDGVKVQFSSHAGITFTADDVADEITSVAHQLIDGETIYLITSGTLPGGLDKKTKYYVLNSTADTFQVALTDGGGPIDITSAGTGTHRWFSVVREVSSTYPQDGETQTRGITLSVPVQDDYVRIFYINGSVGQNRFILDTQLDAEAKTPPLRPLNHDTKDAEIAAVTAAHLRARGTVNGSWNSVRTGTDEDNVAVAVTQHEVDTPIKALGNWRAGQLTVNSASPVQVAASPIAGRKTIAFKNNGAQDVDVFVGHNSAVTESNGYPIAQFESIELELDNGAQLWAILSSAASGATNVVDLSADSTLTNSGVSNPDNAFASDDADATFNDLNDEAEYRIADFTFGPGKDTVQKVELCFEGARAAAGNATVLHQETVSAQQAGGTSITSPTIQGGTDQCYVAFVANGDTDVATVTSVTGLGLIWTKRAELIESVDDSGIAVFTATGSPSAGTVSANFSISVDDAIISVGRYSGVDQANPSQATATAEAAGATQDDFSVGPVAGTATDGIFLAAINGAGVAPTFTTPTTIRTSRTISGEANLQVAEGVAAASNTATGDHGGTPAAWAAIGITLRPALLVDPVIRVSYEVAAEGEGPTTLSQTLTDTTDAIFSVDVTGDRVWTDANIDDTKITLKQTAADAADALIDHVFLRVTEAASTATQRCAFLEVGD